jgi:hypothetical protein
MWAYVHLHGTSFLIQITDTCEYLQVLCLESGELSTNTPTIPLEERAIHKKILR